MAAATPPRQMSLIRYPQDNELEVVLRRGDAVVIYDSTTQHLSVRNAPDHAVELNDCPYCHRPLRDDFTSSRDGPETEEYWANGEPPLNRGRPFVDPDYFGLLAASQRASPAASASGTPAARRWVPHALGSGRSRDVSGAEGLRGGAEPAPSGAPQAPPQGISSSAFCPGFFKQHFREKGELGRGGFGVVLLLEHVMDGMSLGDFACKRIPVGNDHAWLEKTLIEVKLLKTMPHVNIVTCHWVWLEDHQSSQFGPSIPCLWILQDYCNGGDLHSYVLGPRDMSNASQTLKQERMRRRSREDHASMTNLRGRSRLTFDEIFTFFRDITSGLHHLHAKGYIHRDLKPSNCLLKHDDNRTRVLISDFGEVQAAGAKRKNTGATGTISYCAPEVLQKSALGGAFGDFTVKSDIFSLGMIVYFMCFGRLPYSSTDGIDEDAEDVDELRAEISAWRGFTRDTQLREDLPDKLYSYLQRLLSADPNKRPSTEEILRSIKAETGLADMFSVTDDDSPSRFAPVKSPPHRPSSQQRRHSSNLISRLGLSTSERKRSEGQRLQRSPSPIKYDRPRSGERSRPTSVVAVRPKEIELPPSHIDHAPEPQQSPRLMLPPPPDRSVMSAVIRSARHPAVIPVVRVGLFGMKVTSLCLPCMPYAANAYLLYPLLGIAALDLGLLPFSSRRSMLYFGLHLAVVYMVQQRGLLCEGTPLLWHDV